MQQRARTLYVHIIHHIFLSRTAMLSRYYTVYVGAYLSCLVSATRISLQLYIYAGYTYYSLGCFMHLCIICCQSWRKNECAAVAALQGKKKNTASTTTRMTASRGISGTRYMRGCVQTVYALVTQKARYCAIKKWEETKFKAHAIVA